MAVTSNQVVVAATATLIVPASNTGFPAEREGPGANRRRVIVTNISTGAIFLGGSGVTTSTGYQLAQNGVTTIDLYPDEALYGIVASATSTAEYLATGS